MATTDDPTNPGLQHGVDREPQPQNDVYLVLSEAERAKGFVRPVRRTYIHPLCGVATTMGVALAETFAADPKFYASSYCVKCRMHIIVEQLVWEDGTVVGS